MAKEIAKLLMILGVIFFVVGALIGIGGKFPIGKLPGDFIYRKGSCTFYFPLGTCLLASIVITAIFYFIAKR